MYYFIGGRNAKSGKGLGVLRYSPGFPIEYLEKIEKECLEIEVDSPEKALLIYPIGNKNMVVMQGKKVNGNYFDGRAHVTMHGFLMNIEEFKNIIFRLPAVNGVVFYEKEFKENLKRLPNENFERDVKWFEQWKEEDLLEKVNTETRLELFKMAFYLAKHPEESVYLKFEGSEPERRKVQLEYYQILPYELQEHLYTISNGTCLQSNAQILIGGKTEYKNRERKWESMWIPGTVKTVLGLDWKKRKKIYEFTYQIIKEAGEDVLGVTEKILFTLYENLWEIYRNPEKKCTAAENMLKIYFPKIWNLLREKEMIQTSLQAKTFEYKLSGQEKTEIKTRESDNKQDKKPEEFAEECWEYLENGTNPSFLFSKIRNYYQDKEDEWFEFQNELRERLFGYSIAVSLIGKPEDGKTQCFAKLLLFAYEYHQDEYYSLMWKEDGLLPAPYDMAKVMKFLSSKMEEEQRKVKYYEKVVMDEYLNTMKIPLKKSKRDKLVKANQDEYMEHFNKFDNTEEDEDE